MVTIICCWMNDITVVVKAIVKSCQIQHRAVSHCTCFSTFICTFICCPTCTTIFLLYSTMNTVRKGHGHWRFYCNNYDYGKKSYLCGVIDKKDSGAFTYTFFTTFLYSSPIWNCLNILYTMYTFYKHTCIYRYAHKIAVEDHIFHFLSEN